jgi:hypothetical protein
MSSAPSPCCPVTVARPARHTRQHWDRVAAADRIERLTGLLANHLTTATPLPGHLDEVNRTAVLEAIGVCPGSSITAREKAAIAAAAEKVGVASNSDIGIQITGRVDGQQWIPFIGQGFGAAGVPELGSLLQGACYTPVEHMENRYSHLHALLEQAADAAGGATIALDGRTYQRLWSRADERRVRLGGNANVRVRDQISGSVPRSRASNPPAEADGSTS